MYNIIFALFDNYRAYLFLANLREDLYSKKSLSSDRLEAKDHGEIIKNGQDRTAFHGSTPEESALIKLENKPTAFNPYQPSENE